MILWSEKSGNLIASCSYNMDSRKYTATVVHEDRRAESYSWLCLGYEPRFGMDDQDAFKSCKEAERLAIKLENNK